MTLQRYVRLIGTPVILLSLLGLLLWGGWWGYKNLMAPIPARPLTPCVTQTVGPSLTSKNVQVRVLNGGYRTGLATQVSTTLKSAGFNVIRVGNTDERIKATVIVGAAAENPEVQMVRSYFKGATIRADGRADHTVDVLVGNSFGGMNPNAKPSIAVPGGTVCLPSPSATPSSSPKPAASKSVKPSASASR
ncbi:MAG TPA: LytR C-terminal domain-containing protein [Propionibacteriaceae bacterium]|nr:LytR C-terminal domain-containing protein [Propionibacteriaceae bacterium]